MKSAYERAMERFGGDSAPVSLSDEQRAELAEITQKFQAKIAEKEVFLQGLIAKAMEENNTVELPKLQAQLASEVSRLNNDMEAAKDAVRNRGKS